MEIVIKSLLNGLSAIRSLIIEGKTGLFLHFLSESKEVMLYFMPHRQMFHSSKFLTRVTAIL